ncbi:MAG: hypothetical protein ABSE82_03020 [Nitrososphaerales archaeon]|jgi:cytochrome d ubiquinol oxidase subunit II
MGAVLLLFFYKDTKSSVLEYVVPIWEVTGTFGAFWVVTSYFAYPKLLIPVATLFAPMLIVFLILFVARNTSIVFGEFIKKKRWLDEIKLYRVYGGSTLLLGVIVLVLLSALVSGKGIDLSTSTFSVGNWISSPGSLAFEVGTLVLGVGLAPAFFGLKSLRLKGLCLTVLGVAISTGAYYLYSPSLISPFIIVPSALTILAALLFLYDKTATIVTNKAVFITLLAIIIFSLQFLIYPSVLGQTLSIDSITTTGPVVSEFIAISVVGGVLTAIMTAFYVLIVSRQKNMNREAPKAASAAH